LVDKIKAPTFALPIKKGAKIKSLKIFESLETAEFKRGNVSANIKLEFDKFFPRENTKSCSNNSFTMESLILAQDER
jgi:hypothetical protein